MKQIATFTAGRAMSFYHNRREARALRQAKRFSRSHKALLGEVATEKLFWMRPTNATEGQIREFIKKYEAATSDLERNMLVGELWNGSAIFVGYTLPHSRELLGEEGKPSSLGPLRPGDVCLTEEDMNKNFGER
jgi:hypothetical protein